MTFQLGDQIVELASGRRLSVHVFGDPEGSPVLNCHGGLLSGNDVRPAENDARELGLCVISPDRPGIWKTDRLGGHTILSWVANDVVPLLDHLSIDRFSVMGWSEGGQYALGVASALRDRVDRAVVIAGCVPLDDRSAFRSLNRLDQMLARSARRSTLVLRSYFSMTRALARIAPRALLRAGTSGLPPAEADAVAAQGSWLPSALGEGAHQSAGGVDEYRAFVAPWGFEPESLEVPLTLFQGDLDRLVPPRWVEQLQARIPGSSVEMFPGEGHFIGLTRRREALDVLRATPSNGPGGPPTP